MLQIILDLKKSKLFFEIPIVLEVDFFVFFDSKHTDMLIFLLAKIFAKTKLVNPSPIKQIFIIKI